MKRKADFILRSVADTWVIVPVGAATKSFSGMLTVNETGRFLWELLAQEQTPESLTKALLENYEVTQETAAADADAFVQKLMQVGAVTA